MSRRQAHPRPRRTKDGKGSGGPSISRAKESYDVGKGKPPQMRSITDPDTGEKKIFDFSIPEQAAAGMALIRKAGEKEGAAVSGRKSAIKQAIENRWITEFEIGQLWIDIDNRRHEKTGRPLSMAVKVDMMIKELKDESKGKLTVSQSTVRRWLKAHPPDPEAEAPEFNPRKTKNYLRWVKWADASLGEDTQYNAGINSFLAYWEREGHDWDWLTKSIDPHTPEGIIYWEEFVENVEKWQRWMGTPAGGERTEASARTYTTHFRSLLQRTTVPGYVDRQIKVITAGSKTYPDVIHYIRVSELQRMYDFIPGPGRHLAYTYSGKVKGEPKIKSEHLRVESVEHQLFLNAAMRFSATTGARSGSLPSPKFITPRIDFEEKPGILTANPNLLNNLTYGKREQKSGGNPGAAGGVTGLRLRDVRFTHEIPLIDPVSKKEKRAIVPVVLRIHEKQDHTWRNIPLAPDTVDAMEKYLVERFNTELPKNYWDLEKGERRRKLDMYIVKYSDSKRTEFHNMQKVAVADLQRHMNDGAKAEKVNDIRKQWATKLQHEYQKQLFFEYKRTGKNIKSSHIVSPQKHLRLCTYATLRKAIESGNPIMDETGAPWTPDRLQSNTQESPWHLFRKTYAQNMRERGMPLDVLARYAVGWDDLSTLEKYYARLDERTRHKWYQEINNPSN